MNLFARIRDLRESLRVEPPAFPNKRFAFALALLGMAAFTIAGIGGYRSSPAVLRSAMVYHPLLLFAWGALLVFTLLNWILNNPLEPQASKAGQPAVAPIQPTGFQRWSSRVVTGLGVLVVGVLVVRPDVVDTTISNIANHFDTEAGKVVANLFNFYFVVVFVGDIALRYLWSPAIRTLRRMPPFRKVTKNQQSASGLQVRSAHGSKTRKLRRAMLLRGSDNAYDEWSQVRQIAVDFFVFGVLLVVLSQLMRSDFLNVVFAQSRAGGVSNTSPLNAHLSDCTVSWFGSRCTPGIHPSHLPTLTVLDLVLALMCGAFGFTMLGLGWMVQKVIKKEPSTPSTGDVTPSALQSLSLGSRATQDADVPVSRIHERPGEPAEEKDDIEKALVDLPHGFMRYVIAVIRSMRILWPVSLIAAIACIALAAHYSQFYLHALSCEHQLFFDHSANDCGGFHAAPVDLASINYRYLLSAIILSVLAALFIIAAVALLEFRWGLSPNQGLQDSKNGLQMLWYWLRILGHFVARIVWPLIPVTIGLALANGAYKLIAENIFGQPPVPLPFAPPGVLTWFALATYILFRPIPRMFARASRLGARAKVPVAPK